MERFAHPPRLWGLYSRHAVFMVIARRSAILWRSNMVFLSDRNSRLDESRIQYLGRNVIHYAKGVLGKLQLLPCRALSNFICTALNSFVLTIGGFALSSRQSLGATDRDGVAIVIYACPVTRLGYGA